MEPVVVRIRAVDARDIAFADEISAMHRVCFHYDIGPATLDAGFWWIGVDQDGEPACFGGMWPSTSDPENGGYLCRAGVMPIYRGLGLQRRLIRVREIAARRLGWRTMVSDTCDNAFSANNFIDAGYRMFEPSKPWAVDGSCYWRKDLR